jgi:hypothetical protein
MSLATDPQLQLLVDQLTRMYDALQSMRLGVGQQDPVLFRVMAEGPLDEIRQLQQAIDEYTGVAELREEHIDVWVRIKGAEVELESAPTSIVTAVLDALRKGVQSVAEVMTRGELSTRPTKELKEAADMRVVALAPGSLQIGLRVAGDPDSPEHPESMAVVEQALRLVFDAAGSVASDRETPPNADEAMQLAIWNAVKTLVPRERGGIDLVELHGRLVPGTGPIRLTRDVHGRIDRKLEQLVSEEVETHRGVVREIDLDKRTFTLRGPNEKSVRCAFPVELTEIAKEALDHLVEASGTRTRHGKRRSGPLRLVRLGIVEMDDDN